MRCNCVSPGGIRDAQPDSFVKQLREPHALCAGWDARQDVVGATVFLASDAASYITGHNLVVDGGWTAAMSAEVPDRVLVVGSGSIAARHVRNLLGLGVSEVLVVTRRDLSVDSRLPGRAYHRAPDLPEDCPRSRSSPTTRIAMCPPLWTW